MFVWNSGAFENDENIRTSETIVSFASSRLSHNYRLIILTINYGSPDHRHHRYYYYIIDVSVDKKKNKVYVVEGPSNFAIHHLDYSSRETFTIFPFFFLEMDRNLIFWLVAFFRCSNSWNVIIRLLEYKVTEIQSYNLTYRVYDFFSSFMVYEKSIIFRFSFF